MRTLVRLLPLLVIAAVTTPAAWSLTSDPKPYSLDDESVIYLGKIGLTGHQSIMQALQAIKISLKQPQSNDPALADQIVCRLESIPGTSTKQYLTCATNRILAKKHDLLQATVMSTMSNSNGPTAQKTSSSAASHEPGPSNPSCSSEACYENTIDILDQVLDMNPGRYIHVQVNGPALHHLLESLPNPKPDTIGLTPQAATEAAPAAATHS